VRINNKTKELRVMKYNKKEFENKEYWKDGSNGHCAECASPCEEPQNSYCDRCNEEYEKSCNEEVA
tara:strand:- start:1879 stop:2076 length:198 start_codon:yes stop_codon:yes gene_type:complete